MADALVMVRPEGEPARPQRVWGLLVESDTHGPASATFVTAGRLAKFVEVDILIDGLVIADGWVEACEGLGDGSNLHAVTVWGWQRHLDDDLFVASYMLTGFEGAIDAREAAGVDLRYWVPEAMVMVDKNMTITVQNCVWYQNQAAGVTFDLGPGGRGASEVWVSQAEQEFPTCTLYVKTHSQRYNHYPVGGLNLAEVGGGVNTYPGGPYVSGSRSAAKWRVFRGPANTNRYLTVYLHRTGSLNLTYDAAAPYAAILDDIRINLVPGRQGDGSLIYPSDTVASILAFAPKLTLGTNTVSASTLLGLRTDGYQSPRQMLERINIDQWRYRVNPGRVLTRGPFPTVPALGVSGEASSRLVAPEKYSRVAVLYRDLMGDPRELFTSVGSPRQRTQAISLEGTATAAQAQTVADAFMTDQADRRVEGQVSVAPGMLVERPSGQPLHPSRLLLAGGDRLWLEEAEDHGRVVRVSYTHDTETAQVDLTEPMDDLDRTLAHLANRPT